MLRGQAAERTPTPTLAPPNIHSSFGLESHAYVPLLPPRGHLEKVGGGGGAGCSSEPGPLSTK